MNSELAQKLLEIVADLLATGGAALIVVILTKLASYAGLKLDDAKQEKIKGYAAQVIRAAEEKFTKDSDLIEDVVEKGDKILKPVAEGKDKLTYAIKKVIQKFPNVDEAEADEIIHSILLDEGFGTATNKLLKAMESQESKS